MNREEMKDPEQCKDMDEIRFAIDIIDEEIVKKVALRSKYVNAAAKFKKNELEVKDEQRVQRVLESKNKLAIKEGVSPILISKLYETMIDFFINSEMEAWKK